MARMILISCDECPINTCEEGQFFKACALKYKSFSVCELRLIVTKTNDYVVNRKTEVGEWVHD